MRQNWPERLWLVRHGQSQGNVARDAADESARTKSTSYAGCRCAAFGTRDRSGRGSGRWFAALPAEDRPEIILSSPYVRAKQTAEIICKKARLPGVKAKTSSTSDFANGSSAFSIG